MRVSTANKNRRRKQRRAVYVAAKAYHEARVARLWASGRLDKLATSGFARRHAAQQKWVRRVAKAMAVALDCPSRPWFRLSIGDHQTASEDWLRKQFGSGGAQSGWAP